MKTRHLTIYVGDDEPRDGLAFLWIHRDPVTGYILLQVLNDFREWKTIADSSMIAVNMQKTLEILEGYIEDAQEAIAAAQVLADHAEPIVGDNENWWMYDKETEQYVDSGYPSRGQQGVIGPTPDLSIGTVTTGAAGSSAAATITGTPEAPVLNLTIPTGPQGPQGTPAIGFQDVTSAEDGTIVITLTSGDTITIDLNHEHPQYPKYHLCEDQAEYDAIVSPDNDTLYLIPETE